jgi:hypothetical protein
MGSEIKAGGVERDEDETAQGERRFFPMKIGNATVFIQQTGVATLEEDLGGELYVAAPDPQQIFDKAVDVIRECVRTVGEQVEALAEKAMPKEITIEFSLTFDAKAKGAIIPVFVTAEHGLHTGLKVIAKWEPKTKKTN